MRYMAVTLLLVVLTPFAVRAQSPDPAQTEGVKKPLMQVGSVTYTLPESWHLKQDHYMAVVGLLQLSVLYPLEEEKEPTVLFPAQAAKESEEEKIMIARVTLAATQPLEDFRSLKEMWNSRPPRPQNYVVLFDVFHGDNWRTFAAKGIYHGEPYVSLNCSGLIGKQHAGLGFWLVTDGRHPEPLRRAVADFNTVCESLKINGQKQLYTKLDADGILKLLGVDVKKDDPSRNF